MIQYIKGNLFTSNAKVLVNTVNTVGVMGKGIAADFKRYYPEMYKSYKELCDSGKFDIGNLYLYKTSNKWILNFPTKKNWRNKSKLEYIELGLKKLIENAEQLQITDMAMPKLGCGNGGLDWDTEVKPVVEKYLKKAPINVSIYEFDKDIVPEFLKQKDIEEWLLSDPANLTFKLFIEDLKNAYETNKLFPKKAILAKKEYEVTFDEIEKTFNLSKNELKIILSLDDIKPLFYTLKNLGKLCASDLYHNHVQYGEEVLDFFSILSYVLKNEDKVILSYTQKSKDIELEVFDE